MCGVWPKNCVFFCVTFQRGLLSIAFEVLFGCAACGLICCGDSRELRCFSAVNGCAAYCLGQFFGLHCWPRPALYRVKTKKGTTEVIPFLRFKMGLNQRPPD